MSNAAPTPPADDFPAGQTGNMRDVLLSPQTEAKPATAATGPWQPPTAEELQRLLPQYEITALLGRGGMGAVYKGRQIALDRPVAIKILSDTLEEADASFAERFKNEARALGKLSHPGIVGVYDFGEAANGLLYIVMEFIDGTDVAKMLSQHKRLHTEHAMAITAHVCDALAYAHERGIIHRDIKPANIMVGYDGVVKVADFGLAKMTHSQNSGLTQSGMAMGTLHYMAPEALMLGAGVDHRADIYAVGVMLYQMLTGKVPQGLFELPSLQVPGLDPRYDGIIGKALREDRELRYPSVLNMRHDLDAILTQPVVKVEATAEKAPAALQTQARPQRPGGQSYRPPQAEVILRTEKKSTALMWTVVVTLAALAAWLLLNRPTNQTEQSQTTKDQPTAETTVDRSASTSDPTHATKGVPFVNSLGMKFVPIPGTDLLFCVHETRRQDYSVYANTAPGVDEAWKNQRHSGLPCGDKENHPVVGVNWQDAQKFCEWISQKEGRTYRLPTDEEWSIAVGLEGKEKRRAEDTPEMLRQKQMTVFPWDGNYPPRSEDRAGNYADTTWKEAAPNEQGMPDYTDGFATTAPVMSFKPSQLGLCDMGGNVWEWVEDWWNAEQKSRVLRGASFFNSFERGDQLASNRFRLVPSYRSFDVGFRIVMKRTEGAKPLSALNQTAPKVTATPLSTPVVPVTVPVGPTTWTDTKGRSIPATFKAIASGNMLLDIAGKVTPVPLNTLSAESQKLALEMDAARQQADASDPAKATRQQPFINSLGMRFVPVPSTTVLFCVHETRYQDYAIFAGDNLSISSSWKRQELDGFLPAERPGEHPVAYVSWDDSHAFCEWLSRKEGRSYRLPTDLEWSIAAGIQNEERRQPDGMVEDVIGLSNSFPWGKTWPPPTGSGNFSDESRRLKAPRQGSQYLDGYDDGFPTTAPVMSFPANRLGIHDLGGNVWEWLEDWWDAQKTQRVMRGGSLQDFEPPSLSLSSRNNLPSGYRNYNRGFRCVFEVTQVSIQKGDAATAGVAQPPAPSGAVASPARTSSPTITKDKPFMNTLGMKFVPVPGTKVLFSIWEARVRDYTVFARSNKVDDSWKNRQRNGIPVAHESDHPVVAVNWEEAQAFCRWLTDKETTAGKLTKGWLYRLPKDEEWSIAVGLTSEEGTSPSQKGARSQEHYPWGNTFPPPIAKIGNYADSSWHDAFPNDMWMNGYTDGFPTTAPVGSFPANLHGIHDLGGNVWEWCDDLLTPQGTKRVLRGGSWGNSSRDDLRSACRYFFAEPESRPHSYGFRCVLELP